MMLPLTQSALATFASASASASAAATKFMSPTRTSCVRKLVAPSRFRYEPYGARVVVVNNNNTATPAAASPSSVTSSHQQHHPLGIVVSAVPSLLNHNSFYNYPTSTDCSGNVMPLKFTPYPQPHRSSSSKAGNASSLNGATAVSSSSSASFSSAGEQSMSLSTSKYTWGAAASYLDCPLMDDCSIRSSTSTDSTTANNATAVHIVKAAAPATTVTSQQRKRSSESLKAKASATAAAVVAEPTPRFAVVRMKHESFTFSVAFRIAVGDTVVVDGDRGENIGIVSEVSTIEPNFSVTSRVVRRATEKDLATLAIQRERETAATLSTRAVAESLGLAGRVEDVEYQFDMNKLTIFVRRPTKTTFVDFRKLQRSLFREFRCRIWCAYMDEVEAAEEGERVR